MFSFQRIDTVDWVTGMTSVW